MPITKTGNIKGPAGVAGSPGAAGIPAYSLTTADFTIPAVGSTVTVNLADTSWAVVGEYVWVAGAGGSPTSAMALQITAKTAGTVTLLNPVPTGATISADSGNLLTVGSDNLIYLPLSRIPNLTTSASGLAPALPSVRPTGKFLRGDATFAYPPVTTMTTAAFTMPNYGANVSVSVDDVSWMEGGIYLRVPGPVFGQFQYMTVSSIPNNTTVVLTNATGPASSGTVPAGTTLTYAALFTMGANYPGMVPPPPNDATKALLGNGVWGTPSGVNGGFVSKTGAYTLTPADSNKYIICSGGSWTLTLPTAAFGLAYFLRNDQGIAAGSTTGTITIQPPAGTINGQASIALLPQQECSLMNDGTNWRTFGLKREVILGTLDITSATPNAILQLPVGYRYFEIQMTGYIPVTSNDYLAGQFSTDGGNTFLTAGSYYTGVNYNSSATAVAYSDLEGATQFHFSVNEVVSGGLCGNAFAKIYPGSVSPARYPTITSMSGSRYTTYNYQWFGHGLWNAAALVNAIKIFPNSGGNITSAYFTVKGVA